jgi:molecular chaperone DnaK
MRKAHLRWKGSEPEYRCNDNPFPLKEAAMPYALGIDVGTTFTAAAITRLGEGEEPASLPLILGRHGATVPSVMSIGDDGQVLIGESAERSGRNRPDRLVREFTRRIGDSVPIVVGELSIAPEDIFATMARWVVDRAEEREGTPPDVITVTHPASWREHKTTLVREALAGVGLADVTLMSETEAAALHYASQEPVDVGETIAVYDLGADTFDIAILTKTGAQTFEAVGRSEGIERLGGADFDDAVFEHVATHSTEAFAGVDTTDPGVLLALSRLRRECTGAKEALSFDSEASIPVSLAGAQRQVRIVRSEFESMIEAPVRRTIAALRHALRTAGIEADALAAVLLIGGSSRVPLVAQLLSHELQRPIAIDADPKASISLGAAFAAASALPEAASVQGSSEPARELVDEDTEAANLPGRARTARARAAARSLFALSARAFQTVRLIGMAAAVGVILAVAGSTPASPNLTSGGTSATDEGTSGVGESIEDATPTSERPPPTTEQAPNPYLRPPIEPDDRGTVKPPASLPVAPRSEPKVIEPGEGDTSTEVSDAPAADATTDSAPDPAPQPDPVPASDPEPPPVPEPDPATGPVPEPQPEPAPEPEPQPEPAPEPEPQPEPPSEPAPDTAPVTSPEPVTPQAPVPVPGGGGAGEP